MVYSSHMETNPAPAPASPSSRSPKFVRWAVMLGIVIALNVFFLVVRALVFPSPQYEDFCPQSRLPSPTTEQACAAQDGIWNPAAPEAIEAKTVGQAGYCDVTTKCQKPFDEAQKSYQLKAFVLTVAFGIVALIIGVLPIGSSIVSTGLSYGGVLAFLIASIQYWNEAGSYVRLGISGLALIALIYIGIKRFRD